MNPDKGEWPSSTTSAILYLLSLPILYGNIITFALTTSDMPACDRGGEACGKPPTLFFPSLLLTVVSVGILLAIAIRLSDNRDVTQDKGSPLFSWQRTWYRLVLGLLVPEAIKVVGDAARKE